MDELCSFWFTSQNYTPNHLFAVEPWSLGLSSCISRARHLAMICDARLLRKCLHPCMLNFLLMKRMPRPNGTTPHMHKIWIGLQSPGLQFKWIGQRTRFGRNVHPAVMLTVKSQHWLLMVVVHTRQRLHLWEGCKNTFWLDVSPILNTKMALAFTKTTGTNTAVIGQGLRGYDQRCCFSCEQYVLRQWHGCLSYHMLTYSWWLQH